MQRQVVLEATSGLNGVTSIFADNKDESGGSHQYWVTVAGEPSVDTYVNFQKGRVEDTGVNGVPEEALIAVLIDRLQGLMAGPQCSKEIACAITKLQEAQMWLERKTRLAAAVEVQRVQPEGVLKEANS